MVSSAPCDSRPSGLARIHFRRESCKGCGYCIEICPKRVYREALAYNVMGYPLPEIAHEEDCIACLRCQTLCPDLALFIEPV